MKTPMLSEVAYTGIKNLIVSGEIAPLGRLVETDLAARLNVGRAPVREALRSLEREGIVETVPRWGSYVRQLSAQELLEMWQLREVLDGLACRLLAERITAQELSQLQLLCSNYRRHAEAGNEEECDAIDIKFHRQIAQWSGNRPLVKILDLFLILAKSVVFTECPPEVLLEVAGDHEKLVGFLENRDAIAAEEWARQHVSHGARLNKSTLTQMAKDAAIMGDTAAKQSIPRRTKPSRRQKSSAGNKE